MKSNQKKPRGYTIAEVMIVLAVSGVMFLIAANFINGKEERSAFTQGINEMASRIQDVVEQVTDGQYSDIDLTCTFLGSSTSVVPGGASQGTNSDCVFLGKVLHFSENGSATAYELFSVAGGRADSSGNPITSLSSAAPSVAHVLTTEQTMPQQLQVHKLTVTDAVTRSRVSSFAIGFFQGQGTFDLMTGNLQNGTQTVALYYVAGMTSNENQSNAEAQVNGSSLMAATNADVCVTDNHQYADILIGSNNNQLSINVQRDGTTPC